MSTELRRHETSQVINLMTKPEARECVSQIKTHLNSAREKIYDLYKREGWRALDYLSWRECVVKEFASSQAYLYRQLEAAKVELHISPMGEIGDTPERQLRPLTPFLKDAKDVDEKTAQEFFQKTWAIVKNTAPSDKEGEPIITASHVQAVADVVEGILTSGGLDDGSGEVKPLGVLVDAAVTEEVYERLQRQKEHIKQSVEKIDGDEWCTPEKIIEDARKVMGGIDLDPASNDLAQKIVKALTYYTKDDDGLKKNWSGRVWLNSPFSFPLIKSFIDKAIGEYESGNISTAIILVNSSTDTDWFHSLLGRFPACLTRGRISFYHPERESQSNRIGQAFFYLGKDFKKFCEVFSKHGTITRKV